MCFQSCRRLMRGRTTRGTGLVRPDVLLARDDEDDDRHRLVIAKQASFMVGGTVIQNPGDFDPNHPTAAGQTLHGNHAYVQFQIPPNARELPLVMWHGANQSGRPGNRLPKGETGIRRSSSAVASPCTSSISRGEVERAVGRRL